jgi:hypothetical protein
VNVLRLRVLRLRVLRLRVLRLRVLRLRVLRLRRSIASSCRLAPALRVRAGWRRHCEFASRTSRFANIALRERRDEGAR